MADLLIHPIEIFRHDTGRHLPVGGVAGLDYDVLVLANFDYRWNVRMPAVVTGLRLVLKPFVSVNFHELRHLLNLLRPARESPHEISRLYVAIPDSSPSERIIVR